MKELVRELGSRSDLQFDYCADSDPRSVDSSGSRSIREMLEDATFGP